MRSMGSSPPRVDAIEMLVAAPGFPTELGRRFTKVIEHCTVQNTLMAPPEVTITVDAGASPPSSLTSAGGNPS